MTWDILYDLQSSFEAGAMVRGRPAPSQPARYGLHGEDECRSDHVLRC